MNGLWDWPHWLSCSRQFSQEADRAGLAAWECRAAFLWHLVLSPPTICGALSTEQLPAGTRGPLQTHLHLASSKLGGDQMPASLRTPRSSMFLLKAATCYMFPLLRVSGNVSHSERSNERKVVKVNAICPYLWKTGVEDRLVHHSSHRSGFPWLD